MRLLRATVVAAVAALALGGCSDESHDPADSMSTWTPSGTVDSPSPSETATEAPSEPELPEAATKATEDGARAFIAYYWDLVNYAQVTGDVKAINRVSGPECHRCAATAKAVRDQYRSGGHITDGNYEPTITKIVQLNAQSTDVYAFRGQVGVHNEAHIAVDGNGNETPYTASDANYSMAVIWADEQWRLDVLEKE